jgi:indolepyruvate ferredoxin oxidoreductase
VSVDPNVSAFRAGRQWIADPQSPVGRFAPRQRDAEEVTTQRAEMLGRRRANRYREQMMRTEGLDPEIRRVVAVRIAELTDYQSASLAGHYLARVLAVNEAEQSVAGAEGALTAAVARNLFKLLAYKDEYEVARLYLRRDFDDAVAERFEAPVRIDYHLHPPILRRLCGGSKIRVKPWFRLVFRGLRATRGLRGSVLDPFAQQSVRREERELIRWYEQLLDDALPALSEETMPLLVELAELPQAIRGYDHVKTENVTRAHSRARLLMKRVSGPTLPVLHVEETRHTSDLHH